MVVVTTLLLAALVSSPPPETTLGGASPGTVPVWTVDGGGGVSTAGAYALQGTIGQPDAAISTGGNYALAGGFWSAVVELPLFQDGFESGDTSAWSTSTP